MTFQFIIYQSRTLITAEELLTTVEIMYGIPYGLL